MSTRSQAVARSGDYSGSCGEPWGGPSRLAEWGGASGRRYQHLVYDLLACPLAPKANYVLARRDADGHTTVLKVGRTSHDAPTLNRAQIRHEAAVLGASEVHLHIFARTEAERVRIEHDIAATAYIGDEMPVPAICH